jgi:lipase chaperone LimK
MELIMVKTQIYITEDEQRYLDELSSKSGLGKDDLIRNAIDNLIARSVAAPRLDTLRRCRGMWQERAESDFREIRHEVEKRIGT